MLTKSTFTGDGRLVVAATESAFHIWLAADGHLARTVRLHTQAGFPLVVSGKGYRHNLVATGSTLHTSILVWDIDAAVQVSSFIRSFKCFSGRRQSDYWISEQKRKKLKLLQMKWFWRIVLYVSDFSHLVC